MFDDSLNFDSPADKAIKNATQSKPTLSSTLRFDGYNADITESYYWFYNFAYYTGKGYTTIKLEDYHYFSETSQFGAQMRQVKGGSIRAFQENLTQLIQLIKVHLFPLLKEVKQADFYYRWIRKITQEDEKYQKLKKDGKENSDEAKASRKERNEAISHLKDKWVSEVDGGRLWQIQRSSTEQGLDFSLLPQLFLGTTIDDPLNTETLSEQLENSLYNVQISREAKDAAARFHTRFHLWLPSAIKDTEVTFKVKITTLKQFYSQIQMYINFMKPLLMEIQKKSEGYHFDSLYHNFEAENPDFAMLLDTSYMYVKTLGIKGFERAGLKFDVLEFTRHGLWIPEKYKSKKDTIIQGIMKGKAGFVANELKDGKYEFYESDKKDISFDDFKKLKKVIIDKEDLVKFSCIQLEFKQTRRTETQMVSQQGQQAAQQVPFMLNTIVVSGYAWNFFEIASYRHKIKNKNLELLESFIGELSEIKDDLLYYANYFDGKEEQEKSSEEKKKNDDNKEEWDKTLVFGPFKGIYDVFKPILPTFSKKEEKDESSGEGADHKEHKIIKLNSIDDAWKMYSIYKKTHGHMMY